MKKPANRTKLAGLSVDLTAHLSAWYLDKFGIERQCVVVTTSGFFEGLLAVVGLDGEPLDVDPRDVFYVPNSDDLNRSISLG